MKEYDEEDEVGIEGEGNNPEVTSTYTSGGAAASYDRARPCVTYPGSPRAHCQCDVRLRRRSTRRKKSPSGVMPRNKHCLRAESEEDPA